MLITLFEIVKLVMSSVLVISNSIINIRVIESEDVRAALHQRNNTIYPLQIRSYKLK
jgi:hypothetical protein